MYDNCRPVTKSKVNTNASASTRAKRGGVSSFLLPLQNVVQPIIVQMASLAKCFQVQIVVVGAVVVKVCNGQNYPTQF